ncbi:MAG: hypothetical protein RLZZ292_3861 [Bacteroidota bacterium]|jgi:hypothetical protein
MKKILLSLFLTLSATFLFAQKNVLKARIGATFLPIPVYSIGGGYERFIRKNISLQALYNVTGYSYGQSDGYPYDSKTIVPELRYYFNRVKSLNKAFFVGIFNDFNKTTISAGGESIPNAPPIAAIQKNIAPGMLLGKNFNLKKHWYIECYAGAKYQIGTETWFTNTGQTKESLRGWRPRVGVNLAYCF